MKKFLKNVMEISLIVCMVFSATACSKQEMSNATPEEVIKAAVQKMEQVDSFESETVIDEQMSMGEESDSSKMIVNTISFRNPIKTKIETIMENRQEIQTIEMYIDKTEGSAKLYSNTEGRWYQRTLTEEELQGFLSEGDVTQYLGAVTKLENVATEQVNNKNTTKYSGMIVGEDIKKIGDGEMLEGAIINTDMTEQQLYEQIGDVPVFIYIDEQGYPVKFEIDLKNMMQTVWDISRQNISSEYEIFNDMTIDTMTMTITYQNINNAKDFEIPQQAKEAKQK
ncbi:DUF6612 family protein [Clostridium sp. MD294]|uniref:DUF6612 family protein n=1 Tax=Clostridium sp. MD294 TaxID=97138 RepID=UPI0002CABE2A|nr:DUF6612 family protein [Clostridium sp. MD294]NDO46647.1 hypothetical protein [Clostridium sp. MD294]USF28920.1 hypothetical protein C820_000300 [Clostridium sp. MD294]